MTAKGYFEAHKDYHFFDIVLVIHLTTKCLQA